MSYGIVALEIVSESEIALAYPDYDCSWEEEAPDKFKDILWSFGIDLSKSVERQDGLFHRNRLNQVVFCSRWVGESRQDKEWLESGFASKEAIDKSSGSKLLADLYKQKGYF